MFNIARESLVDKADNSIYKLVILTAKRALDIAEGAAKLVEIPANIKPVIIALEEIHQGKISCCKSEEKKETKHEKK
jgi:DNA-directed RNA polymerase omega subunit